MIKCNHKLRLKLSTKPHKLKKFTACCISIFFILSGHTYAQSRQIVIDPSVTFQKLEFFTASDAWSGNFVGKYWDEEQKGQIAQWLFRNCLNFIFEFC